MTIEALQFTAPELEKIALAYPHLSLDESVHKLLHNGLEKRKKGPQKGYPLLRRSTDIRNKYALYEDGKRRIERQNLSFKAHESAVKELARVLGI